jgi:hypothetical protein
MDKGIASKSRGLTEYGGRLEKHVEEPYRLNIAFVEIAIFLINVKPTN